jgi:activator of HSP90 ATPase
VGDWSNNTLRAALSAFKHTMNDATFSIVEITTLTGEASVSIRKGKKIISFDYNIVLKWQCVLADSDGHQISKVEGKYELPEVANDTEWEDWECRVEYGEDPDNLR